MLKGTEFNKNFTPKGGKSVYTQEQNTLHELLASEYENVRFEYRNEQEAINARQAIILYIYIKANKQPLNAFQRKNFVFVVRNEDVCTN